MLFVLSEILVIDVQRATNTHVSWVRKIGAILRTGL